ncbi:MAG: lactate utilization protein B, partial [Actinomycetes bacterium]
MSDVGEHRASTALAGRSGLHPDRPDWAASDLPAHRRPLPLLTREAIGRPESGRTADRLDHRSHEWAQDQWPGRLGELRERAAALRRETLRDLDGHLDRLTARIEEAGGVVHRARTQHEAADIVARLARDRGVRLALKSKSMVSEEIHLNARLESDGVQVVETDLGEYIVQLGDERPAHIVAPAIHLSREDVAARFSGLEGGPGRDEDAVTLARFARERLREDYHHADMGISGVNFAAADTGTLAIVTNEGNADLVTSQPPVHVALMTVDKVIPRLSDLGTLVPLLSYAGAHQQVSVSQTLVTGPRREGETDGPQELHVVILDGGRRDIVGTRYEEVLTCIRCGACQTACPVFRTLGGGHAYGSVYGGPIGAVLTPLLSDRPEDRDLPYLSSLCGACGDVCPVKIPLPDMLVDLRADAVQAASDRKGAASRTAWRMWATAWSSPRGYALSATFARAGGRLLPRRWAARLPGLPGGWARGRTMPVTSRAG